MDLSDFSSARKLDNSGELKKSADLFSADVAGAVAPAINLAGKSNIPPPIPENIEPASMSLEEIRAELRIISGTPLRDDTDRQRRQILWRQLDQLIAARTLAWGRRQ